MEQLRKERQQLTDTATVSLSLSLSLSPSLVREREGNTLVKKKSNTVLSSMAVPEPITYNTGSCLSPSKCFESQFLGEATITPENFRPELTNQLG